MEFSPGFDVVVGNMAAAEAFAGVQELAGVFGGLATTDPLAVVVAGAVVDFGSLGQRGDFAGFGATGIEGGTALVGGSAGEQSTDGGGPLEKFCRYVSYYERLSYDFECVRYVQQIPYSVESDEIGLLRHIIT